MSSSKAAPPLLPGVYRDDPDDRAETASMSSAVLLDEIESFPDEELPAYSDSPSSSVIKPPQAIRPPGLSPYMQEPHSTSLTTLTNCRPPPSLPFSTKNADCSEIRTRFPDYSHNTETLLEMIHDQAQFPPTYLVWLTGTHTETSRSGNKETKNKVTDFFIQINLTNLLTTGLRQGGYIELLPDNKRGYRGGIIPQLMPTVGTGDQEDQVDEIRNWCEHYVQNPAKIKSFMLKREIINHDTKKLEQLLRSAISETNYRGHLHIEFKTQHRHVVVYSPGFVNEWRITNWIRWVFYLTFLWLITWPLLFLFTKKYEVVKAVYPYADLPVDDGGNRKCTVMSEVEWFHRWESAIKRAALALMKCKDSPLDETYRIETMKADARGQIAALAPRETLRTGNAIADSALSFLGEGLRVAEGWSAQRGWGADS